LFVLLNAGRRGCFWLWCWPPERAVAPLGRIRHPHLPTTGGLPGRKLPAQDGCIKRAAPVAQQLGTALAIQDTEIQLPLLLDQIHTPLQGEQVSDGGGTSLFHLQLAMLDLALQLDAVEGGISFLHRLPQAFRRQIRWRGAFEPLIQQGIYLHLVPEWINCIEGEAALQGTAPLSCCLAMHGLQIGTQVGLAGEGDGGVQYLAPLHQIQLLPLYLQAAALAGLLAPLAAQAE